MNKFGYYKLFTVSPKMKIARPLHNVTEHITAIDKITSQYKKNSVILFPEMSISAYTCEDLFLNEQVLGDTLTAISELTEHSKKHSSIVVVGAPLESSGRLFNTAVVLFQGKVLAVIPKTYIVNYGEFYEARQFTSGAGVDEVITLANQEVRLNASQIIKAGELKIAIEICEDSWAASNAAMPLTIPNNHPETKEAAAHLILNLSASNDLIGKNEYRKDLIKSISARLNCGYLYVSAGMFESTRDLIYGGSSFYCEGGSILCEGTRFSLDTEIMECEIDIQKINFDRRRNKTYANCTSSIKINTVLATKEFDQTLDLTRVYDAHPFTPKDETKMKERVEEVLELQSSGLVRRLLSLPPGQQKMVLGLSGGSDSTLVLLVCKKAVEKLNKYGYSNFTMKDIHAISMPGFGSSERTKKQARDLATEIGCSFQEISIVKTTQSHLDDLNHTKVDVVYENGQSRGRAVLLFGMANKVGGIVVGSSDLSESFSNNTSYGGDHLASYNVNATVPKCLVKYIIKHYPAEPGLRTVLDAILDTLVSPELLPLDKDGNIKQSSEDTVGPYEIHDLVMALVLRSGMNQDKIEFIANRCFKNTYTPEVLKKWINESFRRFKVGQFKRTVSMPGVKIGSISLNSRETRLPDDWD